MRETHDPAPARKISLERLILLPFLLLFLVIFGFLALSSWRSDLRAAEQMGEALNRQLAGQVVAQLDALFDVPGRLLAANAGMIANGVLPLDDADALERHFVAQVRAFPNVTNLAFASVAGDYVCAYRLWDAPQEVMISTATLASGMESFTVDAHDNRGSLIIRHPNFRVAERPWYDVGIKADGPVWFPVYPFFSGKSLGVGMVEPIRDARGSLRGVLLADISLHEASRYLAELKLGRGGYAFVMESDGRLIADSTGVPTLHARDGRVERIGAMRSTHAEIRAAAAAISQRLAPGAGGAWSGSLKVEGKTQLVHAVRYVRGDGLDLVVGVVTPRATYLEPMLSGPRRQLLLGVVLMLLGLVVGRLIARAISKPMRELSVVSARVANDEWAGEVPRSRVTEIATLSAAFSTMVRKLQDAVSLLESRVQERTAALGDANAKLQELARTDGLTGLVNRRGFDEALDAEWRRGSRDGQPLALLLCDLDRFKDYNDAYGHVAGDACLAAVARALQGIGRRSTDVVARIGGEEFGILLPGCTPAEAQASAERARMAVESLGMKHEFTSDGIVTLSIGVACAMPGPDVEAGIVDLRRRADAALYRAKRGGRNRVEKDQAAT
ncbi:MAG: diguanylate cyclase [Xanthomonadaceae bacterium]|nr:diguanylate cyclase [Xanthomonadaceae bacterium]